MIIDLIKKFIKNYTINKKILLGAKALFVSRKNYKKIDNINQTELKIFSQNGEDGIIDYLLESLLIQKPKFVEIGVGDYSEANTRFIFETRSPKGLIVDCNKHLEKKVKKNIKLWKSDISIVEDFVTSQNITSILKKNNFHNQVDLFSLDVDGIDYWILKELPKNFSKIAILEFNPYFGPTNSITIPNIKNFDRSKYHSSMLYFGMSLKAAIDLMSKKNLTFVGSNLMRNNAFFVRKDLLKKLSLKNITQKNLKNYVDANFREGRNTKGELSYLSKDEIIKKIKNCEVIDLKKSIKLKIKSIKIK